MPEYTSQHLQVSVPRDPAALLCISIDITSPLQSNTITAVNAMHDDYSELSLTVVHITLRVRGEPSMTPEDKT